MARSLNQGAALGALSLTSLIDIVFLLLIFFLVATRFAEEERDMDVTLPTATEAQPLIATPKEVFVNIDKEGRFFIDGSVIAADEVENVLRRVVTNNPVNRTVIIRADEDAKHKFVVVVMDACNKVGISDYTVAIAD